MGTDPFVERVREANDIVQVVGSQIELRPSGSQLRGLCPFHREKTPSFFVSPERQLFHCYGCGTGGDLFTYVMQREGMSFPEALAFLAERAGLEVPSNRGGSTAEVGRIRQALTVAQSFFQSEIQSPAGEAARRYLYGRGFGPEIVERYRLGLAPDAWDGLLRHARSLLSERILVEAGLAVDKGNGKIYDRFRNRVTIPIETPTRSLIAFGGRILGEGEPKYLNSPETEHYKKGSTLFGIPQARDAMRLEGRVIVVEGYFDVLGLVQGGIGAVVGTCGTALTEEQATVLARFGHRIVLLFDGDTAGKRAALKALPAVTGRIDDVRIAFPPAGIDPDDWIREHGREAVEAGLERARTPIAFLESLAVDGDLRRGEAGNLAVDLAAGIDDPLLRDLWIQEIAGRFDLGERAIRERLHQGGAPSRDRTPVRRIEPREGGWKPIEATCLRTAMEHPDRTSDILEIISSVPSREPFVSVLRWIAGQADAGVPTAAALVHRAAQELPGGGGLSALAAGSESAPPEAPDRLLEALRRRLHRYRMTQVTRAIRQAEDERDEAALLRLISEKQELMREAAELGRQARAEAEARSDAGPGEDAESSRAPARVQRRAQTEEGGIEEGRGSSHPPDGAGRYDDFDAVDSTEREDERDSEETGGIGF